MYYYLHFSYVKTGIQRMEVVWASPGLKWPSCGSDPDLCDSSYESIAQNSLSLCSLIWKCITHERVVFEQLCTFNSCATCTVVLNVATLHWFLISYLLPIVNAYESYKDQLLPSSAGLNLWHTHFPNDLCQRPLKYIWFPPHFLFLFIFSHCKTRGPSYPYIFTLHFFPPLCSV